METSNTPDHELLRRVQSGCRDAMAAVVARHVDFVYACAHRQVRDAHLAEDVAQAVFVILWTKARTISPQAILHAWLFNTTRYACANAIRMRARRARHEREAAVQRTSQTEHDARCDHPIAPMLDDALAALRERDRSALLLSFFAGKSWNEVGAAMGISADAARKRGDRALDKLRDYFTRRGVAVTGASLALVAQGAAAPASLAREIGTSCAVASLASCAPASVSIGIAKAVIQMMTVAKLKLAGAIAAAVLVTVGAAGAVAIRYQPDPAPAHATPRAMPVVGKLENGVTVEVTALTQRAGKDRAYWNADGTTTNLRFDDSTSEDNPPHTHQMLLKIDGLQVGDGSTWRFSNSSNWSAQPARRDGAPIDDAAQVVTFRPADGASTTDLKVAIAAGAYRTVAAKRDMQEWTHEKDPLGEVILSACADLHGGAGLAYTETFDNHQRRIVAFDADGKEHLPVGRGGERSPRLNLEIVHFDLPLDAIDRIEFQVRPFDQTVTVKDISLVPGKLTRPTISAGPATQPANPDGR